MKSYLTSEKNQIQVLEGRVFIRNNDHKMSSRWHLGKATQKKSTKLESGTKTKKKTSWNLAEGGGGIFFTMKTKTQVIQAVPFSSPIVGGHFSPLERVTFLTIPKKVTSRIARYIITYMLGKVIPPLIGNPSNGSRIPVVRSFGEGLLTKALEALLLLVKMKVGKMDMNIYPPGNWHIPPNGKRKIIFKMDGFQRIC